MKVKTHDLFIRKLVLYQNSHFEITTQEYSIVNIKLLYSLKRIFFKARSYHDFSFGNTFLSFNLVLNLI